MPGLRETLPQLVDRDPNRSCRKGSLGSCWTMGFERFSEMGCVWIFFLRRPGNQPNKRWFIIVGHFSQNGDVRGYTPFLHTPKWRCVWYCLIISAKTTTWICQEEINYYPEDMFFNQLNHTHTIYMNGELEVFKTRRHTCWSCSVANNPILGSTF